MKQYIKLKPLTFTLFLPLLISSCALLGPKYQTPTVDTPNTWNSMPESGLVSESGQNLSDVSWWTRFNDPMLNALIGHALTNNNDIQQAIGNITVAQGQLQKVQMNWVPTISLGASAGAGQSFNFAPNFTNPTISGSIPPGVISNNTNFNFYGAGLVPSYSLNIFQQIKQTAIAKANLVNATAAKDAVRLTVISQVAGSYFTLLALDEQLQEQHQLIADLTQLVKLTNIQYKNGLAALTDVQAYQEQLEQAKMAVPNIEQNIVQTSNALQVLVSNNPGNIERGNKFSAIATTGLIPVNLPSSVLRNRPDIRQAEEQLKIANANIGNATSAFFPTLSLTTPVGAFSSSVSNLFNPTGDFWSTQISAVMPILNLGLYGLIKEKKGQYYIAYYNYIQTVKAAFAQVDNSVSNYAKIQQSKALANNLLQTVTDNYNLNQKNYKAGYISYPQSLASKLTVDNTRITLTQIKLQELQAIVNLYQAMAGGYNYENTAKSKKFGDNHDA